MFNAVGGFLGRMFGTEKSLEKVMDTASTLVDEAFYTKQEKAEDQAAATSEARKMIVDWVASTTGSRLARRGLAFMFAGTYLTHWWAASAADIAAAWTESVATAGKLALTSGMLDTRAETMQPIIMLIVGFYFAAPYMGDVAKAALGKMSK